MARPKAQSTQSGNFVYSTLANDQIYPHYGEITAGSPAPILKKILIRGGAGVATEIGNGIAGETPVGTVTEVSDEDLGYLENSSGFKFHRDGGFLIVVRKQMEMESAVADMNRQDDSAPMTPADFQTEGATISKDGVTINLPVIETE